MKLTSEALLKTSMRLEEEVILSHTENVAQAMERAGLDVAELARLAGVSRRRVRRYLRGKDADIRLHVRLLYVCLAWRAAS